MIVVPLFRVLSPDAFTFREFSLGNVERMRIIAAT